MYPFIYLDQVQVEQSRERSSTFSYASVEQLMISEPSGTHDYSCKLYFFILF